METTRNLLLISVMQQCLSTESDKRTLVLESTVLIHNVCIELVGTNQIKTVFDPEYEHIINLEGCDRIFLPDDHDNNNDFENNNC